MSGRQVVERIWRAPISLIWELWTTAEGLSSWWGPKGFAVEVETMDLQVGGAFTYTMRATSPEVLASMAESGRPTSFSVTATYTAMDPPRKLAYSSPFGDEMLSTSVEFSEVSEGVKMVLVIDASKPEMTGGATKGWKSALDRFGERLNA